MSAFCPEKIFSPPLPPPPPPPLPSRNQTTTNDDSSPDDNSLRCELFCICRWASDTGRCQDSCIKNQICRFCPPYRVTYKNFPNLMQVGPTCGLVALSMLIHQKVTPDDILAVAQTLNFTNNGEMFSVSTMRRLVDIVFEMAEICDVTVTKCNGNLYSHEIINKLVNGAVLMVPYDSDYNHHPCLKKGHKAHWAIVVGIVIGKDPGDDYTSRPDDVFVICSHGKSKYVGYWKLVELAKSNANLKEFSPKRDSDMMTYILPEGGIGGANGLKDQFLLFDGL